MTTTCAATARCRQRASLQLTQGSLVVLVCDKHAGGHLSRMLDPTGTRWGRLPVMVRSLVDDSVAPSHDCAACPDCKGTTCCQRVTGELPAWHMTTEAIGGPQVPQVG